MRELITDLFISLDGFASGVNQPPYFGYFGQELGAWVHDHLDEPQVIIMGRVTYEALARFPPSATDPVSLRMSDLPKLVVSSSLQEPLSWKNTRLLKGNVVDEIYSGYELAHLELMETKVLDSRLMLLIYRKNKNPFQKERGQPGTFAVCGHTRSRHIEVQSLLVRGG